MLVLDSGGVTRLAERSKQTLALVVALREAGLWPPRVPSVVLVECLQGHAGRDAVENKFLKTCDIDVPENLDFDRLARIVVGLERVIIELASG
ncbi:MAG TPA: hypothetical protein VJN18_04105 [Polyangiaceae bacterium]|nr:hypothetical protein [Polyangiaceae bacterium]